jgi:hypothetical protein
MYSMLGLSSCHGQILLLVIPMVHGARLAKYPSLCLMQHLPYMVPFSIATSWSYFESCLNIDLLDEGQTRVQVTYWVSDTKSEVLMAKPHGGC